MATTMKSNDSAIRAMQEMLQQKCLEEPAFALKMASPSKSMEGAINYLCHQVQKSGLTCLDNQSVASILYHYFDEADIEEVKNVNCNIVVSRPELTDEDKAELREQAMEQYKEEQLRAIRRKNEPKVQANATATANNPKAQEINVEQGNLFGEDF